MEIEDRFWSKVAVGSPVDCWPWTAGLRGAGYGQFHARGRSILAHRWAFESFHGPLPPDACGLKRIRELDHLCRNRRCVNPGHLELVTKLENIQRGVSANGQKTHCKHGHEFTEENTYRRPDGSRKCRACHRREERSGRVARARVQEAV